MIGETDLSALIGSMEPVLHAPIYLFCMLPLGRGVPAGCEPVMLFREGEGTTLIVTDDDARQLGLGGTFPCRMITLAVQSSLDAVGFIAAVSRALADAGIGVNPVAAFHHDHLFVPADRADEALAVLHQLAVGGHSLINPISPDEGRVGASPGHPD